MQSNNKSKKKENTFRDLYKSIRKPATKPSFAFKDKKKEENKNECRKKNNF
jgi:hypothetical protein